MEKIKLSDTLSMDRMIHGHWRLLDWKMTSDELLTFAKEIMDLGMTTIDTADIYGGYGCEEAFGKALAKDKGLREKLTIITKCGIIIPTKNRPEYTSHYYNQSRKHIIESAERSLKYMHTDYLDLLLIHRPSPMMDPAEISEAFRELYQSGKVKNFGVSNFSPSQFDLLSSYVERPLVNNQVEISPLHLDPFRDGTLDHLMMKGISPMAWSPLAGGDLFTKTDEKTTAVREALLAVGENHGENRLDTLAYAFLLSHPGKILPIVGSGKIERVKNALEATKVKFSQEEWLTVYKAALGEDLP